MSILPGADYLGIGFKVYGNYDMSERTFQLFDLGTTSGEYTAGDQTYEVPTNVVTFPPSEPAVFEERMFDTVDEFVRNLKTSASIAGEIGAFEGKATAKYSHLCDGIANATLCTISDSRPSYYIDLRSLDRNNLREDVRSAMQALPTTYSESTRHDFFRFFHKYGTNFVKSITMGGRLNYYYAYNKKTNNSTEAVKATVNASYGALLKGEGQAGWKAVDKHSFQSSRVTIESMPAGSLNALAPAFGQDLGDAYTDWARSAREAPSLISFRLQPITELFAGEDNYEAVGEARDEFTSAYLFAESTQMQEWPFPGRVSVAGRPLDPDNAEQIKSHTTGWNWITRQVIVDRHTLRICLNKAYGYKYGSTGIESVTGDMLADLKPYDNPDHILIVTTKVLPAAHWGFAVCADMVGGWKQTPSQTLYFDVLKRAGAGQGLESMIHNNFLSTGGARGFSNTAYTFVGLLGSGPGKEMFAADASGDVWHDPKILVALEPVEKRGQLSYDVIA